MCLQGAGKIVHENKKNTSWQLLLFKSCSLLCRALTSRSKKKLPRQAHKHPPTVFHYKPVCTIYEKHLSSWCRVNTRVTACAWVPVWMKDGADRLASQSEAVLFCCASSISTLHHKKMLTHTYEIHTDTHIYTPVCGPELSGVTVKLQRYHLYSSFTSARM